MKRNYDIMTPSAKLLAEQQTAADEHDALVARILNNTQAGFTGTKPNHNKYAKKSRPQDAD
jgi:hypothetical protein